MSKTLFITGIDTDAGKSYATGHLGNLLSSEGLAVRTMKFIQTGNVGRSEDIELHRRIMGQPIEGEDFSLSAPQIRSYPCSPDLAARIDNSSIDLAAIDKARLRNEELCDILLLEGAGGIMVPIDDSTTTIDYISSRALDVALVTNGRLGSINHTLLSLEAIQRRAIPLRYLLYNAFYDYDSTIADDTRRYLKNHLAAHFPDAKWVEIPHLTLL